MKRLYFEIGRTPVIHQIGDFDEVKYISCFEKKPNVLETKYYDKFEEAYEYYKQESEKPELFIRVENTKSRTEEILYIDIYGKTVGKSILVRDIERRHKRLTKCKIEFSETVIKFIFYNYEPNVEKPIRKSLTRLITHRTRPSIRDSDYYEIIPNFSDYDIIKELTFITGIIKEKLWFNTTENLEAELMKKKKDMDTSQSDLKDAIDEFPPLLKNNSEPRNETPLFPSKQLSEFIGFDKIKLELEELTALAHLRKKRIDAGLAVTPTTLHLIFTGNSGTGKTTVARLLGKIYKQIGLLKSDKVIEVSRQDLVAGYVGQTAKKTKEQFEKALGGILFIDEAYSLYKKGNDFGLESIETLLKLMEDNRENIVIVFAGYPKEMENLLSANPGLKSRFPKIIHFEDFNKDELAKIFKTFAVGKDYQLSKGAEFKVDHIIEENFENGIFSSNARTIRNWFEAATLKQANRLKSNLKPTKNELMEILDTDIPNIPG